MSSTFDLEDLLAESSEVLEGISDLEAFAKASAEQANADQLRQFHKKSLKHITSGVELQLDGYFELVSADDEKAVMDFFPPSGDRKPIRVESVLETLAEEGIVHGIDTRAVQDAVLRCNTARVPVEGVVAARATEQVEEQPEHYRLLDELVDTEPGEDVDEKRSVDHRARSAFRLVKKGDLLAERVPMVRGQAGMSIRGKATPYKRARVQSVVAGRNTTEDKTGIVAQIDGRVAVERQKVWISPVLTVQGNVDYSTGNINFPGDVVIQGEVESGFTVITGGDLICHKTLDATEVEVDGNLTVHQGIIGRGTGTVKVKGSARMKFLENCHLEVGGDVWITTGAVNSAIYTTGSLKTGPKGIIVGGRVSAQEGVLARQIGTGSGPKTEIYCGTDFGVEQRLEMIKERSVKLAMQLRKITDRAQSAREGSPDWEHLHAAELKIRAAITQLNEAASKLVFQLDKSEEARVVVLGEVQPGTYIEICHLPYVVDRTLASVSFSLSKKDGAIRCDPIRPGDMKGGGG